MKKESKKEFGCRYEGYESDNGNNFSGAVTLRKGKEVLETNKEFLDFIAKEMKIWISNGLKKNRNKQFVLVFNFEESRRKTKS